MQKKPTALVILDGFGHRDEKSYNAVAHAYKPALDRLMSECPHTLLQASGPAVGLPEGYMGNSEVGHMTIGSGRVTKQPISRLNDMIDDGSFFANDELRVCLQKAKNATGRVHIMGLLSDGGVHSHERHIHAFVQAAAQEGIEEIFVHPFLDGRDTAPQRATTYLERLEAILKQSGGIIGSLHGRYYAMDRDQHWDRTKISYDVLTTPQEQSAISWVTAISVSYERDETDEFLYPILLDDRAVIGDGDGVIFANVRPDRARQLTTAFVQKDFTHFPRRQLALSFFLTPVAYDHYDEVSVMFEHTHLADTLIDCLAAAGKSIFSIAETEKYAHVTYFFSGGRQEPVTGETRVLIQSIPARTYVDHPCMSAPEITKKVLESLHAEPCDFYLINYANADMVGHSGDFDAAVKAVECLDEQVARLYEQLVENMDGTMYLTADHGNAEQMFDEMRNMPHTAHTTNPVPFVVCSKGQCDGQHPAPQLTELADIAPYILAHMGLLVPETMR